eukprot:1156641-Pelagomonas_calceolata.AAC.14
MGCTAVSAYEGSIVSSRKEIQFLDQALSSPAVNTLHINEGKVGLHLDIRLQGQLGGNIEACNKTWPRHVQLINLCTTTCKSRKGKGRE